MRFYEFKVNHKPMLAEGARIDHAEDIIFDEGSRGAARALEAFRKLETGGHKDVTVKWDGSPAIIFGRNENGEFVLTDKSGFTAKGYDGRSTSAKDLETMLLNRKISRGLDVTPDWSLFASNMKDIFDEYEKAVPKNFKGYFKGDLLYYNTPDVQEGKYVFTPQLVTYKIDVNSDLGKRVGRSKTGVIVHRMVNEEGAESAITVDLNNFFQGDEVLVFPPVTVESPPEIDNSRIDALREQISKNAGAIDTLLDKGKLTQLKLTDLPRIFYSYVNNKVDTGLENIGKDFFDWLKNSKVSAPKQQRIVQYIGENQTGYTAMWTVFNDIMELKDQIIADLDKNTPAVEASINDKPGGEGYVLAHPRGDIKLVPRVHFSRENRAKQR